MWTRCRGGGGRDEQQRRGLDGREPGCLGSLDERHGRTRVGDGGHDRGGAGAVAERDDGSGELITTLAPLVDDPWLSPCDVIEASGNPLAMQDLEEVVPQLCAFPLVVLGTGFGCHKCDL